jgi:hypothetical protein
VTKKHFIALADAIREHDNFVLHPYRTGMGEDKDIMLFNNHHLETLADFCKSQNSSFNRERWLDYIAGKCGPSGGELR